MKNVNLDVEVRMLRVTPSHELLGGSSWLAMGIDQTIHLACVLSPHNIRIRQTGGDDCFLRQEETMHENRETKVKGGVGFLFCLTGDYHN